MAGPTMITVAFDRIFFGLFSGFQNRDLEIRNSSSEGSRLIQGSRLSSKYPLKLLQHWYFLPFIFDL